MEIIRRASKNFQFDPLFDAENIDGTEYSARFQGFIHPLGATTSVGSALKVYLVAVAAHAWLNISTDDSPAQEVSNFGVLWGPLYGFRFSSLQLRIIAVHIRGDEEVILFSEEQLFQILLS